MGTGKVIRPIRDKGWQIFTRPYELNIIGLRSAQTKANSFDDEIHVIFRDSMGKTLHHIYKATTDPGTYWLKNPSMPKGTAILKEGQYRDSYQLGLHRGKYTSLVQVKPVTVIRDMNRDSTLDFNGGKEDTGLFGIDIHRAGITGSTYNIDEYSAGCQVLQNASDFNEFIALCEKHRSLYGNKFTYTLIDFRTARRSAQRHFIYLSVSLFAVAIYLLYGTRIFEFPAIFTNSIFGKGMDKSGRRRGK